MEQILTNDLTTIPFILFFFTLSPSINWGPDRFHQDFWWLYTNYRFQREVSSPSLPSSTSSSPTSIRCPPSLDSSVRSPSTTVGTKVSYILWTRASSILSSSSVPEMDASTEDCIHCKAARTWNIPFSCTVSRTSWQNSPRGMQRTFTTSMLTSA